MSLSLVELLFGSFELSKRISEDHSENDPKPEDVKEKSGRIRKIWLHRLASSWKNFSPILSDRGRKPGGTAEAGGEKGASVLVCIGFRFVGSGPDTFWQPAFLGKTVLEWDGSEENPKCIFCGDEQGKGKISFLRLRNHDLK